MLQVTDTAAAGQDEPHEEPATLSEPTIIRRGKQTLTYQQQELVKLATQEAEIDETITELLRIKRRLQADRDRILDMVEARGSIALHPNPDQRRYIRLFEMAMQGTDPEFLKMTFDFCEQCGAHRTNWIDGQRQPMMVAFTRRLSEMGEPGGAK